MAALGAGDDPREDADLLRAHAEGDPAAFGVLFARHRDRMWAVALRTTGSREDAEDALQEAMIAAFRRASAYRGEAAVTTWLHRIVVNASLDRLRRNTVRAADPLPDDLEQRVVRAPGLATAVAGESADPERYAVAAERRSRILTALEQLPPDQKAALVLVDMEGYPVATVADILEVPTGTVKSRCARGRARLAALLPDLRQGTASSAAASDRGDPTTRVGDVARGGEQP